MGWTTGDLRDDLEVLKNMYKSTNDSKTKEKLVSAIHGVMKTIAEIEIEDGKPYSMYDFWLLMEQMPRFEMYLPEIKHFHNVFNSQEHRLPDDAFLNIPKSSLTNKDVDNLLRGFYSTMPNKYNRTFLMHYNQKDRYLNYAKGIEGTEGITYMIPVLNKEYISIGADGDKREQLVTLTHEYGHQIAHKLRDGRYCSDDFYVEIESIFFQLLGEDYYAKETNDPLFKTKLQYHPQYYVNNSKEVLSYKRVIDKTFANMTSADDAYELCDKYLAKEGFDPEEVQIEADDIMKYTYSYLVAVELFEIYQDDKELAFNLLEKIVKRGKRTSEYDSIHDNVTPVKSLKKHIRRVFED